MSDFENFENESSEEIHDQLQALALKGMAASTREALAKIEKDLDGGRKLDLLSFGAGALFATLGGHPAAMPMIVHTLRRLAPLVETGLPNPDTAFDDLPTFDPENGS